MSHNTHGALAFLACVACSLAPAIGAEQAPIPDFTPNSNVGWGTSGEGFGADFVQPPSGPGPVTNDPAYPHLTTVPPGDACAVRDSCRERWQPDLR
jgi:hypothetical protein